MRSHRVYSLDRKANFFKPLIIWLGIGLCSFLTVSILVVLIRIFKVAILQLKEPVLRHDSWVFILNHGNNVFDKFKWLLSGHNGHRIVFAKLSVLIETDLLQLPPASTAILQNFIFILLSLWALFIICRIILNDSWKVFIVWASSSAVLVNPWQWENFFWEFQSPWFLTNLLSLIGTVFLLRMQAYRFLTFLRLLFCIMLPLAAIFATGQGLALALPFCLILLMVSRKTGIVAGFSLIIASLLFFILLYRDGLLFSYEYVFSLSCFIRAFFWSPWSGGGLLVIFLFIFLLVLVINKSSHGNNLTPSILMLPGFFSIIFVSMLAFFRSNTGPVLMEETSRYITHIVMLPISLILIVSYELDRNQQIQVKRNSLLLWLLIPLAVVFCNFLFFSQLTGSRHRNWYEALNQGERMYKLNADYFRCLVSEVHLMELGASSASQCSGCPAAQESIVSYLQGRSSIPLFGYHKLLKEKHVPTLAPSLRGAYEYVIEEYNVAEGEVSIKGEASQKDNLAACLFIVANYNDSRRVYYPIGDKFNYSNIYSKNFIRNPSKFSLNIPRRNAKGFSLESIEIFGESGRMSLKDF